MVRVKHPPGGDTKLDKEVAKDSRTVRVLKPPGGGSSIAFDEDDHPLKPKTCPQAVKAPAVEKTSTQQTSPAKPETNGTASSPPDTPATTTSPSDSIPSVNGSATDTPAPAVNGTAINGTTTSTSSTGGSDDFPAVNGSGSTGSLSQGSMSQGTPSSHSSPSTPSTPSSARLDTQNRLFGADPVVTPARRIRDHHRSNIFTPDNIAHSVTNGTPKPAAPSAATESSLGDKGTPPEQPKSQRQRIPPGGFSTQLW